MSFKSKCRITVGILLIILFIIPFSVSNIKQYLSLPNEIIAFQQEQPISLPELNHSTIATHPLIENNHLYPKEIGTSSVVYKVKNIPVKKVDLEVLKEHKIVPGGQSIGVQLHTLGVLVVGHHLVKDLQNNASPAEQADIKVGDIILEMNGKPIKQLTELKKIVDQAGKNKQNISVKIKRGNELMEKSIKPALNKDENKFQIGIYIRDSTTGIGTISFYDEVTGKYGALGHVISDSDTKKPIEIYQGKIVRSVVTNIEKGNQGFPGEKQAKFSMQDNMLGNIEKNSPFGIFGKLNPQQMIQKQKPLPIGFAKEVKKGPAKILTVVDGEKVEEFDIEIVNSLPQTFPSTKGMIIKVTDERLLEKTGGIVQGMSGSPIIQNNKLIGAVTHVFVNDPTAGYGVHIEWMLEEAGINIKEQIDQTNPQEVKAL